MLAVLFRAVAKPGGRDVLLEFLKSDSRQSSKEAGTLRFDVIEDPDDDHAFFVYELYRNDPAFDTHKNSPAFLEWNDRIMPQLAAFSILCRRDAEAVLREHDAVKFDTKMIPAKRDGVAPDGSDVRVLLGLNAGGMAHFELAPNQVSKAVTHQNVEEIWFFVSGRGQMWRKQDGQASIVDVVPGVCLTIPLGTHFQFRSIGGEPLTAVGVTMPPWPGASEALVVEGQWTPTVR